MLIKVEECIRKAMRHDAHSMTRFFLKYYMRLFYPACDIPLTVQLGEGTRFIHRAIGVCVHGEAVIGKGCKIMQNVTIGGRNGRGAPTIGDYCFIGCNTNLVAPVKVGDGAYTAAGSTITKDVPAQALGIARERQTNLEGWAEPKMEAYIAKKQKLENEQNK